MLLSGPRAEMKVLEQCASSQEGQLGQGDLPGPWLAWLLASSRAPLASALQQPLRIPFSPACEHHTVVSAPPVPRLSLGLREGEWLVTSHDW